MVNDIFKALCNLCVVPMSTLLGQGLAILQFIYAPLVCTCWSNLLGDSGSILATQNVEPRVLPKAKEKVQLCTGQHVPPGGPMENIRIIGIELGVLSTTKHTGEDCNFFHQLVIHSMIIPKHILLPYDPGGLALQLYKCGGVLDSRMFIIGLRASRISREEECNTRPLGCHDRVYNLDLGFDMGHGPTLCGFGASSISHVLVLLREASIIDQ